MIRGLRFFVLISSGLIILFYLIGGGFGNKPKAILNNGDVTVFAHKGNIEYEVSNSILAFECSAEQGFTANEIDINSTLDGKLILFHDDTCNRLLGIDAKIREIEWDSIKDNKLWFNWRPTPYSTVSLKQFFQYYNPEYLVYLDIKEPTKAIADSLLEVLKIQKNQNNILIANSNILFLSYIKWNNSNVKTVLEGFKKGKEWVYYLTPKNFKPDFYSSYLKDVNTDHMEFLKNNDLLKNKIVYGVDYKNISDAYLFGVQNIIIEYSDTLGSLNEIKRQLDLNKLFQ